MQRPLAVTILALGLLSSVLFYAQPISAVRAFVDEPTKTRTPPSAVATVRDMGARGDGVTDDTAAVRRALASGVTFFPAGTYRLTQTIEIALPEVGFTTLRGDGAARIVMAGAGPAFRFVGTHAGTADPGSFQEKVWQRERMPGVELLEIVGEHLEADGIEARGTMQLTVSRVNVRRVRHAIHLVERNRNVLIADCHLYENRGIGIYLDHVNLHQTNISACHISYNRGGGVVVRGGDVRNVHIAGCDIEGNMAADAPPTANVLFDSTDGSMAEGAIVGCTIQHEMKSPESANIRVIGRGEVLRKNEKIPVRCGHLTIADNVLSDVQVNVDLSGVRGVTIVGNTFWQGYTANLRVVDSQHVVVGANAMERNPLYGYTTEASNRVLFQDCQDCTIQGLHLHDVRDAEAGLVLRHCRRIHLTGCTILDCAPIGLLLDDVRDSRIGELMVRDDAAPDRPAATPVVVRAGGENTIAPELLTPAARR